MPGGAPNRVPPVLFLLPGAEIELAQSQLIANVTARAGSGISVNAIMPSVMEWGHLGYE